MKRAGEIKQNKRRETLIENADNARISLRLVTLDDKVPLKEQPAEFAVHQPDPKELIAFLKAMEFGTITKRVAAHFEIADVDAIAAAPRVAQCAPKLKIELPKADARRPDADAIRAPIDHNAYVTVTAAKELDAWVVRATAEGIVCVDTETTSLDPHAGGPLRRVAGGGAGRGLLHSLRPSQRRRPATVIGETAAPSSRWAKPMCWRG